MPGSAIDAAISTLTRTGRARIRVMTRDHRATENRLRNRAAWISKPHARLVISGVRYGNGYLEADLLLDASE